ncbi:hypothetical protein ABID23_001050 [Bartonella silvatica]|uniref:Uncharacterized protein n=1 Tax=Bartonella silvatica TaxID=357760 RepID=A0ABV2HHC2_9HYPH
MFFSNYHKVKMKEATGLLKVEALALIIEACSEFGGGYWLEMA